MERKSLAMFFLMDRLRTGLVVNSDIIKCKFEISQSTVDRIISECKSYLITEYNYSSFLMFDKNKKTYYIE